MFSIKLYNNIAESNRLDKTNYLQVQYEINGVLRDGCSIIDPIFIVQTTDSIILNRNYAYISEFKRYYFITNITFLTNSLVELQMHVDVLMSFKEEIINLTGLLNRTSNPNLTSNDVIDKNLPFTRDITIYTFEIPPYPGFHDFYADNPLNDYFYPTVALTTLSKKKANVGGQQPVNNLYKYGDIVNFNGSYEYVINNTNDGVFIFRLYGATPGDIADALNDAIVWFADDANGRGSFLFNIFIYPFDIDNVVNSTYLEPVDNDFNNFKVPYNDTIQNFGDSYHVFLSFLNSESQQRPSFYYTYKYNRYFNDFRDFEPFSKIEIMLPFDKSVEIDINNLIDYPYINIVYIMNFKNGTADIYIVLSKLEHTDLRVNENDNNEYLRVYHNNVQVGIEVPMNLTNNEQINREKTGLILKYVGGLLGNILGGAGKAAQGFMKSGPKGAIASGAETTGEIISDSFDFAGQLVQLVPSGYSSATDSQVGNVCSYLRRPTIIIKRNKSAVEPTNSDYLSISGRPSGKISSISNLKGYTFHSFYDIHIENITATLNEKDEILFILKTGFLY